MRSIARFTTKKLPFTIIAFSLMTLLSCKKVQNQIGNNENSSEPTATDRGPQGKTQRCTVVLPQVEKVSLPIFRKVYEFAQKSETQKLPQNKIAKAAHKVAISTQTMLNNMMLSQTEPIHPLAFFSMVKDFESAADLTWSQVDSSGAARYFKTANCTSGECFGMFQVDVKQEPDFQQGAICKGEGLGIWEMKGGADFCAALFWWTLGGGETKCEAIASRGNPCLDKDYPWTLEMVNFGRKAYVQEAQWGSNSWKENYLNYKECLVDKHGSLEQAISAFKSSLDPLDSTENTSMTRTDDGKSSASAQSETNIKNQSTKTTTPVSKSVPEKKYSVRQKSVCGVIASQQGYSKYSFVIIILPFLVAFCSAVRGGRIQ
jgi:hypothetical protein